jgi:hypothetical protein
MRYEEPASSEPSEIRSALSRGDAETAARLIVGLTLHALDLQAAIEVCSEATRVADEVVRGNAILGLGHLARRFRQIDRVRVEPLILAGLKDVSAYVRGQAQAAADDVHHFLGWQFGA